MYNVTELIAKFDKTNHKKIVSSTVDRKNHSFSSLKELAMFTREHTIFTSYQKEITGIPRTNKAGRELYIGNNLLWLDLDFDVNLVTLKRKLEELNLTCFAYYSSSYYNNSKAHARLCIICHERLNIDSWDQSLFFANQVLRKLELNKVEKTDKSIYNLSSYLAKVEGIFQKRELFVVEGKLFKWISQEKVIEEINVLPAKKRKKLLEEACFGYTGDLSFFLCSLNSISEAVARNNNTISLSFTSIPEKTKLGYYIKVDDPWFVFHPSKDPKYLSTLLSVNEFKKFKEFYLERESIFKDDREIIFDKEVNLPFITTDLFKKGELLFIESPTGTGKTTSISEWLTSQTNKSVLFISVNRMQAVATSKSLQEKLGFICYLKCSLKEYHLEKKGRKLVDIYNLEFQKDVEEGIFPNRLICGVLSLHHLADEFGNLRKKYDYVIIDEVSTLPNSISNSIGLVFERLDTFELGLRTLKKVLTSAERVICMDGFVSNTVINLMEKLSNKQPYTIRNNIPTNKVVEIFTCSGNQPKFEGKGTCRKFLDNITADIKEANYQKTGRLMVVALSSLDMSIKLKEHLQKHFPDKKIEIFNSDVTEKDGEKVIRIFENLDLFLKQENIDIMIYSPTITTGVDIPQAKETNVYQIISGDHLLSHTNYQMTMRGRKANSYRVLISKSLMIDKKIPTFKEYVKNSLENVRDSIPFKSKKPMKFKSRWFQTSGLLLAYKELEYNVSKLEWENIIDLETVLKSIKKLDSYEGVKIALQIDKAFISFQRELYLNGKNGYIQYINFLKHEKCRISIEEDIDYHSPNHYGKYTSNQQKYKDGYTEDYSNQLKNINCWKEEYKELKYRQLYRILKIAKVFYILRSKIRIGEYSNEELLTLYDTLYKKSFLKEYNEFEEFLRKENNKEKIAFMKSMLGIIFSVEPVKYGLIIKLI